MKEAVNVNLTQATKGQQRYDLSFGICHSQIDRCDTSLVVCVPLETMTICDHIDLQEIILHEPNGGS